MKFKTTVDRFVEILLFSPLLLVLWSSPTLAQGNLVDFIVTEARTDKLVRITSAGARTEIFSFATGTFPVAVTVDSNGDFIVSERDSQKLSRITPAGVRTEIFAFAAGTFPHQVAIDRNGDFIATEHSTDKLSRVTQQGSAR